MPVGNRGWTPALVAQLEPPVLDLEPDYEARLPVVTGRHRLVLSLGGIPVSIRTDSDGVRDYLQGAFGALEVPGAEPVVQLDLAEVAPEAFRFRTLIGTLVTFADGDRVIGKFREMAGFVDTRKRFGQGVVAGRNYRQDVGNYLRLVIDAMTPPLDAVLFHTAAVASRGFAWMFFGPSTAGKSTLSKLSAERREIMTDDMLVLRLERGRLRAATCGFWGGETRCYPTRKLDLPVRGLFRLHKGSENRLRPLAPVQAALDVVCGIPTLKRPPRDERFVLDFAAAASRAVPAYELHFHKRDDSFWSLLDELD